MSSSDPLLAAAGCCQVAGACLSPFLATSAGTALSLLFKKTAPALVNDAPDALCDGRQNPGEFKLNADLSVFDIDEAARCLSRHAHSKVEPVAAPHSAIDRHQPSERRDHLIEEVAPQFRTVR